MITTQVQDSSLGVPAARVPVELDLFVAGDGWRETAHGVTNEQGRIMDFSEYPSSGIYRLMFDVASYMPGAFFPSISVTFEVQDPHENHHVALVLSPFGYSVHRGFAE